MLMYDKNIFDRYYCIISGKTKEIMAHSLYLKASSRFHTRKSFHSYAFLCLFCVANVNEWKIIIDPYIAKETSLWT